MTWSLEETIYFELHYLKIELKAWRFITFPVPPIIQQQV